MSERRTLVKNISIKPVDVRESDGKKILDFLNKSDAKEIASKVEIIGEKDVGIKTAEAIVAKRTEVGQFKSLSEILDVRNVGDKRFSDIVVSVLGFSVEPERAQFRELLLQNPNYFGNVKDSIFKPIKAMASNTFYEELKCIGYNPPIKQLEAIVYVKEPFGYGGGICSEGTREYVRFYVDWDDNGTWVDAGLVWFPVYNIWGNKPLEYAVTLKIDAPTVYCKLEKLPKVRAILSWNEPPPENTPDWPPTWGNVRETRIQLGTFNTVGIVKVKDILAAAKITLPPEFAQLDLNQEITPPKPKELTIAELKVAYGDKVPEHRFAFAEAQKLIANTSISPVKAVKLAEIQKFNLGAIVTKIKSMFGDTTFEELSCIGLDTNEDVLAGVVRLKLSSGYSGNLCSTGSLEYVAFWVDWGDGTGWTYAGYSSVRVHDLSKVPPEVDYAVSLPVELSSKRQPCQEGARTAKVRAVLSWNVNPPASNPDYIPTWGNRKETVIHIPPGVATEAGQNTPYIDNVGSMNVCDIEQDENDQKAGLANGPSTGTANFTAKDSPFGGTVTLVGFIANPPHYLSGNPILKYRIWVRRMETGEPWQIVSNSFWVQIREQISTPTPVSRDYLQKADDDGFFEYLEDPYPSTGQWREVVSDVLARWNTYGLTDDLWEIWIEAKNIVSGQSWSMGHITCEDGTILPDRIIVRLDNTPPKAELVMDFLADSSFIDDQTIDLSLTKECGKVKVGKYIIGRFKAKDEAPQINKEHFNYYSLSVLPGSIDGISTPADFKTKPTANSYDILPTTGIPLPATPSYLVKPYYPSPLPDGIWQLGTAGMKPCGYVIRLGVRDRTIVSSSYIGWYAEDTAGFCLEADE